MALSGPSLSRPPSLITWAMGGGLGSTAIVAPQPQESDSDVHERTSGLDDLVSVMQRAPEWELANLEGNPTPSADILGQHGQEGYSADAFAWDAANLLATGRVSDEDFLAARDAVFEFYGQFLATYAIEAPPIGEPATTASAGSPSPAAPVHDEIAAVDASAVQFSGIDLEPSSFSSSASPMPPPPPPPGGGPPPLVSIAIEENVEEGSSTAVTVTRTGSLMMALNVEYRVSGPQPTFGDDYSGITWETGVIPIFANDPSGGMMLYVHTDNFVDPGERLMITLVDNNNPTYDLDLGAYYDTVTFIDDPPVVSLRATEPIATEQGRTPGEFEFYRTGGNTNQQLDVRFQLTGSTATLTTDYGPPLMEVPGQPGIYQVHFITGTSFPVSITPEDDALVEGEELVQFTIVPNPTSPSVNDPARYNIGSRASDMVLIEDNDVGTVVDLDIANGQFGDLLDEAVEWSRGAFTVANLNDTDGDGKTDAIDNFVRGWRSSASEAVLGATSVVVDSLGPNSGAHFSVLDDVYVHEPVAASTGHTSVRSDRRFIIDIIVPERRLILNAPLSRTYATPVVSHGGRQEVDLMELHIHRPSQIIQGAGPMMLSVLAGNVRFWTNRWKETEVTLLAFDPATIAEEGGKTLWAEVRAPSDKVRDIVLSLEYAGVKDVVRATGIWVTQIDVRHDLMEATDLFNEPAWSDIGTRPREAITAFGGLGLRPMPTINGGVSNAIAMQFTIGPTRIEAIDGTWEESDRVYFDVTRQAEREQWDKATPTASWTPSILDIKTPPRSFPANVELPNDDSGNSDGSETDESAVVTEQNHFYSMDAPGLGGSTFAFAAEFSYMMNFNEWLRVGFGKSPEGNQVAGSRTSSIVDWHVTHRLRSDTNAAGGTWLRTQPNETYGENDIGRGHLLKLKYDE